MVEALQKNPKTVQEAIRRWELPARNFVRSWRISPKALEDWLCGPEPLSPEEESLRRVLDEFCMAWQNLDAFLGRGKMSAGIFFVMVEIRVNAS